MGSCIPEPRKSLSKYAPKIDTFKINPDKIKDVIGRGGEMITKIILEASNVNSVNDKNAVKVEINGLLVGYLSRSEAAKLAGKVVNKTVPAVIDGGWKDEESTGSNGVKLAINNVSDLV